MKYYPSLLLSIILLLGASGDVLSQINRVNYSIQAGYHYNILNPRPYNLALTIFNDTRVDISQSFEEVKYTGGFTAALAIHRQRSDLRIQVMTFQQRQEARFTDLQGPMVADTELRGEIYSFQLISKLIPLGRNGNFMVGAGLNATHLQGKSDLFLETSFSSDSELTRRTNDWKGGFIIIAPFQIEITEQILFSLEPYFQVYFGQNDFTPVSEAINTPASAVDPLLKRQMDHPVLNATLIFKFLKP